MKKILLVTEDTVEALADYYAVVAGLKGFDLEVAKKVSEGHAIVLDCEAPYLVIVDMELGQEVTSFIAWLWQDMGLEVPVIALTKKGGLRPPESLKTTVMDKLHTVRDMREVICKLLKS